MSVSPSLSGHSGLSTTARMSSLVFPIPAGALAGDYALIGVNRDGTTSPTTPTGWTLLNTGTATADGQRASIYGKQLVAGDLGTSVTIALNGSNWATGTISTWGGVDAAGVKSTVLTNSANNITPVTMTATGVTAVAAGSVLVGLFCRDATDADSRANGHTAPGTPSGWDALDNAVDGIGWSSQSAAYMTQASAGNAADASAVENNVNGGWITFMVALPPVASAPSSTGTLSATLGAVTASANGTVSTHGSVTAILGAVVLAAAAAMGIHGSTSATLGAATLSATGTAISGISGSVNATLGTVTAAGTGVVPISGTLSEALGGATLSGSGVAPVHGSLSVPLGSTSLSAAGSVVSGIAGSLNATLGQTAAAGSGTVNVGGSLASNLGAASLASTGSAQISGSLNQALGAATLVASGASTPGVHGLLAATLGAATLNGHGAIAAHGSLAVPLGPVSLTSDGSARITGIASSTMGAVSVVGAGVTPVTASLAVALGNTTLAATGRNGTLPALPADGWYYLQLPPRYWYAAMDVRPFYAAMPGRSFYVEATPMPAQFFSSKDSRESVVLTLDATADLDSDETLTAITETDVTTIAGQDPDPAAILGTPNINPTPVTVTLPRGGTVTIGARKGVQVEATAGNGNTTYLIAITCTTSNPDKILTLKGALPVSNG